MPRPTHAHEPRGTTDADDPSRADVLVFDRDAVRAVDRAAIDAFGIPGIVLMENAARGLCERALEMLGGVESAPGRRALIICGAGNNGGDGYALARLLHNHGIEVMIAAIGRPDASSDAGINRSVCEHMRLPMINALDLSEQEPAGFGLVVDAIFGTGLDRPATGDAADAIAWINRAERPVLAVDLPSGMDCNSGQPLGVCVRATVTVTFVGLKTGFLGLDAQTLLGEVAVAGIGAPRDLLERFGRRVRLPQRTDAPAPSATEAPLPRRRRD